MLCPIEVSVAGFENGSCGFWVRCPGESQSNGWNESERRSGVQVLKRSKELTISTKAMDGELS